MILNTHTHKTKTIAIALALGLTLAAVGCASPQIAESSKSDCLQTEAVATNCENDESSWQIEKRKLQKQEMRIFQLETKGNT